MLFFLLLTYSIPLDSPYMDYIEYLQVKGYVDIPSVQPYSMEWLVPELRDLVLQDVSLSAVDKRIVSYFTPLLTKNEDFSYFLHFNGTYESQPEYYYGFFDLAAGGQITNGVRWSSDMRFQRGSETDTLGPVPWNDFQVYLNEGLMKFTIGKLYTEIGRRNFILGYTDESDLLVSRDPQGFDGYYIRIPGRYYEFYTLFSILDPAEQRYLAQHRVGIDFAGFLKLGFSEAILWGGTLEPVYLNFFLPYYISQWGIDRDDNVMWQIDCQLGLFNAIIYGNLLIDDFQYDDEPDDPNPHKLAYKIGVKTIIAQRFLFKTQYTRVDKWVYTQRWPINVWHKDNRPLGYPLGNDVDELRASITFFNVYDVHPYLTFSHVRKGEGSIFVPYEDEGGPTNPPFPSGIVEKKLEFSVGVKYTFRNLLHCAGDIGRRNIDNYRHVDGDNRDDTFFSIGLWTIL